MWCFDWMAPPVWRHKAAYLSAILLLPMDYEINENQKGKRAAPIKRSLCQCREERANRHSLRLVAANSDEWRNGRENPCEAMRPGTRTTVNQSYGIGSVSDATRRRWRLSVFSIAHRRDAVKRCQCLHRQLLTEYRRKHGRPLRLSSLSIAKFNLKSGDFVWRSKVSIMESSEKSINVFLSVPIFISMTRITYISVIP